MSDAPWLQVKALFQATLERPPGERAAFLAAAVGGDEALRREIESLLDSDGSAVGFTDRLPGRDVLPMMGFPSAGFPSGDPIHSGTTFTTNENVGPYRITALLGSGGMGEVFRAHDSKLKRDVALKMLPSAYELDPDRLARFRREAQALAALNHPHIAAIYGLQESNGRQALVLELVEGVTLADRIRKAPLSPIDALTIARQMADALQAAHEKGIIHRDLKPANVKVTPSGVVKVLDFGLAKAAGDPLPTGVSQFPTLPGQTRVGVVVGTAGYMSPEQARGQEVDARTDIWAFGCVLFEMLAGVKAFGADDGSDAIAKILEGEPDWSRLPKKTPAKIQRLLRQCLKKDADRRPQTITAVRQVIEQLLAPRAVSRMWAAIAAATIIAISVGAYVWLARRANSETERNATIAQVERLVDLGRFVDVWQIARAGLQRWSGDARLEAMLRSTSQTVTLRTDPPGAAVAFKAYDDLDGEWISMGQSPLLAVNAPLGMLRWRITKAGFDPLEARFEVGAPAAAAGRPDVDAKPLRLRPVNGSFFGMVFVAGTAPLTDYWIDQTEVTNRDYKQFVDRGRYDDRFYDRSGSPGPATWEFGAYPQGQDAHPVSGVAWFEADAYCRSVGKSLPTIHHWRRAFGEYFFGEVVSVGNFRGRGVESTDALKDVGPAGTSGMAGNVKEWVWNEVEGKRYILGGAWNEPLYMATGDDARPPMDRSPTNGFRCIKETAPSAAVAYEPVPAASGRDYAKAQPVDEASFAAFRRFYCYDRLALEAKTEWTKDFPEWRRERVSFSAAYGGERIIANVLIPKGAAPPYPTVIWFPGSYALALQHSDRDLPFSYYFELLPRSGYAVVYPVYDGTYERRAPLGSQGPVTKTRRRDRILRWSMDLGRTIDYLESRNEFDKDRIAYYGFSMGASTSIPIVAVEPRLKAAIFLAGGLDADHLVSPEADAVNFLPRIEIPVLDIGGRDDFSFLKWQDRFFALLGTPSEHKRHVRLENAGHVPPRIDVIREVLAWLDRYLGRPPPG